MPPFHVCAVRSSTSPHTAQTCQCASSSACHCRAVVCPLAGMVSAHVLPHTVHEYCSSPASVQVAVRTMVCAVKRCPPRAVARVSSAPHSSQRRASSPAAVQSASFVVRHSLQLWPAAGTISLSTAPQVMQACCRSPLCVQVGASTSSQSPQVCSVAATDCVRVCPHTVQVYSVSPSVPGPGSTEVVPSSHVWPTASPAAPHTRQVCQCALASLCQSPPNVCPVAGIVCVSVSPHTVQVCRSAPSSVQVASCPMTHSPQTCPSAAISSVSL